MALTDEDREHIRELHAEGLSRNGISVVTGFRRDDVSTAAEEMGLKFNSKVTEKATRAIAEQNYERRALLMRMQMDEALTLQRRMFEPVVQGQLGGLDNTWNEVELEEPTYADKLRIQQTINGALTNVMKLLEADQNSNRATINLILATAEKLGLTGDGE